MKNFGAHCYHCGDRHVAPTLPDGVRCLACGRDMVYVSGGYIPVGHTLVVVPKIAKGGDDHAPGSASEC